MSEQKAQDGVALGRKLGLVILDALGIDSRRVRRVTLEAGPGEGAIVQLERYITRDELRTLEPTLDDIAETYERRVISEIVTETHELTAATEPVEEPADEP